MNTEKFLELLKIANINQKDLAVMIGSQESSLSRWKREESYPVWLEDYLKGQIAIKRLKNYKAVHSEMLDEIADS